MPKRSPDQECEEIRQAFEACGAHVFGGYSQFEMWEPFERTLSVSRLQATDDILAAFPASLLPLELDLTYSTLTDPGMAHLAKFPNLKMLNLTYAFPDGGVGDKGVAILVRNCPNLTKLYLSPAITDRSLKLVQKLPKLTALAIESSAVTDRGLRHLLSMTGLRKLYLTNSCSRPTRVGDSAMAIVGRMSWLEKLDLFQSKITDAALPFLSGLVELRSLSLGGCKVGAHGLQDLAGMTQLRFINLESTLVTDQSIKVLVSFTNLEYLSLEYTSVSDRVARKIAKRLNLRKIRGKQVWRKPTSFIEQMALLRLGMSQNG